MNMINEFGFRQDARKPRQIRNLIYQMGIYSQADGSSYLEQGGTKVLYILVFNLKINKICRLFVQSMGHMSANFGPGSTRNQRL